MKHKGAQTKLYQLMFKKIWKSRNFTRSKVKVSRFCTKETKTEIPETEWNTNEVQTRHIKKSEFQTSLNNLNHLYLKIIWYRKLPPKGKTEYDTSSCQRQLRINAKKKLSGLNSGRRLLDPEAKPVHWRPLAIDLRNLS